MKKTTQQKLVDKLKKLESFITIYSNDEEKITSFIKKYIECEICYKALLLPYRAEKEKNTANSTLTINIGEVKKVMQYFSYNIDGDVLQKLFSSESTSKKMSAKKIRDEFIHKMSEKSVQECIDRYDEINEYMDTFLNLFREN